MTLYVTPTVTRNKELIDSGTTMVVTIL